MTGQKVSRLIFRQITGDVYIDDKGINDGDFLEMKFVPKGGIWRGLLITKSTVVSYCILSKESDVLGTTMF